MRYFRHTIAEYTCLKHCGYQRSVADANWSLFHLIAATVATVSLWLFSLHEQFPWFYFISVLAGELLLVYCAGFLSSFILLPFRGTFRCKQCGAPMTLCGRHFDPAGSRRPNRSDMAMFVMFVGLNIAVWVGLTKGDL